MEDRHKMGNMERIAKMNTIKPEEMKEAEEQAREIEDSDDNYDSEEWDDEESEDTEAFDDEDSEEEEEQEVQEEVKEKKPVRMEHYGTTVTAVSTPTTEDMFRFMMRHTYFNTVGMIGLMISLSAIVMVIIGFGKESTFTTILLIVVALLFTVINPVNLYLKSSKHVKTISQPGQSIRYNLSDAGIDMARNDEYAAFKWDDVMKVCEGKTGYFVYLGKSQAFILPKHDVVSCESVLRELFTTKLSEKKCRIKKTV